MRIPVTDLSRSLTKGLKPVYLLAGEETPSIKEGIQVIRQAIFDHGYQECERFYLGPQFDWDQFWATLMTPSLFQTHRLIDCRCLEGKWDKQGAQLLLRLATQLPPDMLFIFSFEAWETKPWELPWVQALERIGILALAKSPPKPSAQDLTGVKGVQSRSSVFELVDTAFLGYALKTIQIFNSLKKEGIDPILMLWALIREVRSILALAYALKAGSNWIDAMEALKIWQNKRPVYSRLLEKKSLSFFQSLLLRAQTLDTLLKGGQTFTLSTKTIDEALLTLFMSVAREAK